MSLIALKGCSLMHAGLLYTHGSSIQMDDAEAIKVAKANIGLVELIDTAKSAPTVEEATEKRPDYNEGPDLDSMTVKELLRFANSEDIDLDGARKKDDIIAAIRRAYDADSASDVEEVDGLPPVDPSATI